MADWIRTLDIKDEWARIDEIGVPELAGAISAKLRAVAPYGDRFEGLDDQRESLADDFDALSEYEAASVDEFDYIMAALYDFGDTPLDSKWNGKKALWVKTF